MINFEEITQQIKEIAIETGLFLEQERINFQRNKVVEKNNHDYVSYVDKAAETRIIEKLNSILPEAGIIAEEGTGSYNNEEFCWLIDPLDGTTNYIHDTAPYCVSIALRHHKQIVVAVVYEVCRKECFWAWENSPAFLNGKIIHTSEINKLDSSFIALGFPYQVDKYKKTAIKLVESLYGNVAGLRLQGAAAAELCYIAAGRFEGRIEAFLSPWDIAAGTLILERAGGKITDFEGKDSFHTGHQVLATNGNIHDSLIGILNE